MSSYKLETLLLTAKWEVSCTQIKKGMNVFHFKKTFWTWPNWLSLQNIEEFLTLGDSEIHF